jgi:uncharacterized protein (TIGR02145 family)
MAILNPPSPSPPSIPLGYGLLYNWYAATDVRGIAPSGFRVPSATDFNQLITELGGGSVAGGDLKSTRTSPDEHPRWDLPNTGATDLSEFNGFPAGTRSGSQGTYFNIGKGFSSWSTDLIFGPTVGYSLIFGTANTSAQVTNPIINEGDVIRCVSDTEPPTSTVQDADGNNYTWIQIGSQYWLAQNLKTETFNNGDPIPTGFDNAAWAALTTAGWAYPNGDDTLPI